MTEQDKETVRRVEKADKEQRASEAEQDAANDNRQDTEAQDLTHFVGEPTEEDYERARTVGIGNEPELPPGKVENGGVVRGRSV